MRDIYIYIYIELPTALRAVFVEQDSFETKHRHYAGGDESEARDSCTSSSLALA